MILMEGDQLMTISVNVGLQMTVYQLLSPYPQVKLDAMSKLNNDSVGEEPIRVALTTLTYDKHQGVRETAQKMLGAPAQA